MTNPPDPVPVPRELLERLKAHSNMSLNVYVRMEPNSYYKSAREDLEAIDALLAAPVACPWKPIADAPRCGKDVIILIADRSCASAFWHDGSECYGHRGGEGWFYTEDRGNLLTASNAGSDMYPVIAFMEFDDLLPPNPDPREP